MKATEWSHELREIQAGNIAPVYLVHGPEEVVHHQVGEVLRAQLLLPGTETINQTVFSGKDTSWLEVISALQTPPFLGTHRLVAVHEPPGLTGESDQEIQAILSYLEQPVKQSVLLLSCRQKVDKRRKFFQSIDRCGKVIEAETPKGQTLIAWVRNRAADHGIELDAETAAFLVDRSTENLSSLDQELAKLAAFKQGGGKVTVAEIEFLSPLSRSETIFQWLDAVAAGQTGGAIEHLRRLRRQGEPAMMILHMIARHFRLIGMVKSLSDQGLSVVDIQKKLKQHPFTVRKALSQGKNFQTSLLHKAMYTVLQADLAIKTGRLSEDMALELLTIQLRLL